LKYQEKISTFVNLFTKLYLMKRVLSIIGLVLVFFSFSYGQTGNISGKISEESTGQPASRITVQIPELNLSILSDAEGFFEFKKVVYGKYTINFTSDRYESYGITAELNSVALNLPPITLKKKPSEKEDIEEISTLVLDQEDENKDQGVSGLLHASEDIFLSTSGYVFGSMFFRPRGYDSDGRSVLMNGVDVSDPENGRSSFSDWGGLNDATRNKEVTNCLEPSSATFGKIGGVTYINTRASNYRKQIKFSYSLSNKTYRDRVMLTYSTGMMDNGWAFTLSGSRRWANEGYQEGTFYDGYSYFLAAEKRLGKKHSLALTVFGAPTKRAGSSAVPQEIYDLTGSNYYNPNWGYQKGEKRNARVKYNNEPEIILNHYWTINASTKLNTLASYSFGTNKWSSLNWYTAPDPRPDYYRNLPSYQTDPDAVALYQKNWREDITFRQINWEKLYQANFLSNSIGEQAQYIIENNVTKTSQFTFNTYLNKEVSSHFTASGGVNAKLYTAEHYKVLEDLLTGSYWLDIDKYSERDFSDENSKQNDLNNPNRIIREGDKFGYSYAVHHNSVNLWGQGIFTYDKFDFFAAASLTGTEFWRHGNYRNGRHPDNSYGDSPKHDFLDYALKAGVTYKVTGRHFLTVNGFYMTRAPFFINTYLSPKTRDDVVKDLKSETIYGVDASYIVRYPWLNARLTYFYSRFLNGADITSFYADNLSTFVNYAMTGLAKTQQGIEFGAEIKATKSLSFVAVAAVGQYLITNRPETTVSFDNAISPDITHITYLKNFYVYGTPQTALSLGLKYNYKYWFIDVNANYYDNNWIDVTPERRTEEAIAGLKPGDPLIHEIVDQEKLNGGFTLDASIGKSIRIDYKYFININLSVSNILNNTDIKSGGYEQNRFDFENRDVSAFPSKYYYYFGRTYFLNISFRI
jgi:hypothetical protein